MVAITETIKCTISISKTNYCILVFLLVIQQPFRLFGLNPWVPARLFKLEVK